MLECFQNNRPEINQVPALLRLLSVAHRAESYQDLANHEMEAAGLYPSSREGIWLYIAEESLSGIGQQLSVEQKSTLIELFTVLRRIYKSADDAWDQSPELRKHVMEDPLGRVTQVLSWQQDGIQKITHLSPAFDYLEKRLGDYFPKELEKRNNIRSTYETFVKSAAFALVGFERLKTNRHLTWKDCLNFYQQTTGGIGRAVASIVSQVTETGMETTFYLQEIFEKSSLVSQIVDDIIDSPLDVLDPESPSLVKAMLSLRLEEFQAIVEYSNNHPHISHRMFEKRAPHTADQLKRKIIIPAVDNLPPKIKRFLKDFFNALPPKAVSHQDPMNKEWHTNPEAEEAIRTYVGRKEDDEPYQLVEFMRLNEHPSRHCELAMLIDPEKQSPKEANCRVLNFVNQGGRVILIGGSGEIDHHLFESTVTSITSLTSEFDHVSIIIFPGHIDQIPQSNQGIKGVMNYSYILGNSGSKRFSEVYPAQAQKQVLQTLKERNIPSLPTLYVLCGDAHTSVSQFTGILPIDPLESEQLEFLFGNVAKYLKDGLACVYLEGGSGSSLRIPVETVAIVRRIINQLSPQTLLFVGGGINTPEASANYVSHADCVVIGTHFEVGGTNEVSKFINELVQR